MNGPMTPEQVAETMARTAASIEQHGMWDKICNRCNRSVGGRLAEYGKPSEQDLSYCACPFCWEANTTEGFRTEFIPIPVRQP